MPDNMVRQFHCLASLLLTVALTSYSYLQVEAHNAMDVHERQPGSQIDNQINRKVEDRPNLRKTWTALVRRPRLGAPTFQFPTLGNGHLRTSMLSAGARGPSSSRHWEHTVTGIDFTNRSAGHDGLPGALGRDQIEPNWRIKVHFPTDNSLTQKPSWRSKLILSDMFWALPHTLGGWIESDHGHNFQKTLRQFLPLGHAGDNMLAMRGWRKGCASRAEDRDGDSNRGLLDVAPTSKDWLKLDVVGRVRSEQGYQTPATRDTTDGERSRGDSMEGLTNDEAFPDAMSKSRHSTDSQGKFKPPSFSSFGEHLPREKSSEPLVKTKKEQKNTRVPATKIGEMNRRELLPHTTEQNTLLGRRVEGDPHSMETGKIHNHLPWDLDETPEQKVVLANDTKDIGEPSELPEHGATAHVYDARIIGNHIEKGTDNTDQFLSFWQMYRKNDEMPAFKTQHETAEVSRAQTFENQRETAKVDGTQTFEPQHETAEVDKTTTFKPLHGAIRQHELLTFDIRHGDVEYNEAETIELSQEDIAGAKKNGNRQGSDTLSSVHMRNDTTGDEVASAEIGDKLEAKHKISLDITKSNATETLETPISTLNSTGISPTVASNDIGITEKNIVYGIDGSSATIDGGSKEQRDKPISIKLIDQPGKQALVPPRSRSRRHANTKPNPKSSKSKFSRKVPITSATNTSSARNRPDAPDVEVSSTAPETPVKNVERIVGNVHDTSNNDNVDMSRVRYVVFDVGKSAPQEGGGKDKGKNISQGHQRRGKTSGAPAKELHSHEDLDGLDKVGEGVNNKAGRGGDGEKMPQVDRDGTGVEQGDKAFSTADRGSKGRGHRVRPHDAAKIFIGIGLFLLVVAIFVYFTVRVRPDDQAVRRIDSRTALYEPHPRY